MVRGSHHRNRRSVVNSGGSEVNGFPEKVLLATDGLENTALADRAAVDLAKKSTSERRNHEAFAPSSLITHFHCNLAYRGLSTQIGGTSGA
jgi:hypothetical protein